MRSFTYSSAASLGDVIELLQTPHTRPLAGGTDLLTLIKADLAAPEQLVDIKRISDLPRGIGENGDGITIGALATLADLENSAVLQARYPALAQAAGLAATPQLRNMATVGGNLLQRPRCWYYRNPHIECWLKGGADCPARDGQNQLHALFGAEQCVAVHPSDLAAALLAHETQVVLRGSQGERTLALADFFALPDDRRRTENTLGPDEIVVEVRVPSPCALRSVYLKAMDRKVWAFALVGVAAALEVRDGVIVAARLGSAASPIFPGACRLPNRP